MAHLLLQYFFMRQPVKKFWSILLITIAFVTLQTGVAFANPCNPDGFFNNDSDYIKYYELQEITRKLQKKQTTGNKVNNKPAVARENLRTDDPGIRELAGLFRLVDLKDTSKNLQFPGY